MSDEDWSAFEDRYVRHEWYIRRNRTRGYVGRLASAQGFICAICGTEMDDEPTIDHVIPLAKNGNDGPGNIVAAHRICNNRKADRMPNGCELVYLLAVNAKMGWEPQRW